MKGLKMDKNKIFEQELDYILNPSIRKFAEMVINLLPDYFFEIPASSTGKYHPKYSLGSGGLVRHTRSAVRIAIELSRLDWWKFEKDELDLCIASLLVHDGYKSGVIQERYSRADHPNILRGELEKSLARGFIPPEYFNQVSGMVSRHMGQWNYDYKTHVEILDKPQNKLEKFVHLCDYLASRKCLTMEFEVEVKREG
jgi:hypothetical protein